MPPTGSQRRRSGAHQRRRQRRAVIRRARGQCERCSAPGTEAEPLTIDHVVALSFGGRNDIENLQALCASCARWKSAEESREHVRRWIVERCAHGPDGSGIAWCKRCRKAYARRSCDAVMLVPPAGVQLALYPDVDWWTSEERQVTTICPRPEYL